MISTAGLFDTRSRKFFRPVLLVLTARVTGPVRIATPEPYPRTVSPATRRSSALVSAAAAGVTTPWALS
jgi:hypothetical protein